MIYLPKTDRTLNQERGNEQTEKSNASGLPDGYSLSCRHRSPVVWFQFYPGQCQWRVSFPLQLTLTQWASFLSKWSAPSAVDIVKPRPHALWQYCQPDPDQQSSGLTSISENTPERKAVTD